MAILLTTLEANISIATNSLPMLLPLYSYWRYRKVWGQGEDEYVSRLRGDTPAAGADRARHYTAVEDIVSGVPLEMIYGIDNIHFSVNIGRGSMQMTPSERPSDENDAWESESMQVLSRNSQPTGIQIETKWSITEETVKT